MASFKGNGRDDASKRRAAENRRLRQGKPDLELLEERRLLAIGVGTPVFKPTSNDVYDVRNGPMANTGQDLIGIFREYNDYLQTGAKTPFNSRYANRILIRDAKVGLDVSGFGDFATFRQGLVNLGMEVTGFDARLKIVEGFLPISLLPTVARGSQTVNAEPIYRGVTRSVGSATNQAENVLGADVARQQFNVDGTGQKIGVLSDSVNRFAGGLADSIRTGDLPSDVQVLADGAAGDTDEGRAMLELIHDIAPGADLAFATAGPGPMGFRDNIVALANAGAGIIVDDIGFSNEPFYQDGIIQQGINTVTSQGATYLTSASNAGDAGYESPFRGENTTVGPIGAGLFMDFDPSGGVNTTLPIQVFSGNFRPTFQFDQPNYTVAGVTSQVFFYILDQTNTTIVAQGIANNVATQIPMQTLDRAVAPGQYNVAIRVASGPAPGRVVFNEVAQPTFAVSRLFGNQGGTSYPTVFGHSGGETSISVGAVPFFGAPPFQNRAPITSEPFSSFGPAVSVFTPDGTRKPVEIHLKPDVSAPDFTNTSFFIPGQVVNTTNQLVNPLPTFPGDPPTTFPTPPTATNVAQALPTFTGTSASAPNLAAAVALMKQANPGATRQIITDALTSTATPLNGSPQGAWNVQGGFGLVNLPAAIRAAQTLRIVFISPGAGQTVSTVPAFLQVQFNQPVNLATFVPGSFQVQGPNGATVTVGQPFGFDNPLFPTFVRFPITITPAPGRIANGAYTSLFLAGSITSQTGQILQAGIADTFTLAQLNGPRVVTTTFNGRIATVTFDVPVDPNTVNTSTVFLFRAGDVNNSNVFGPNQVVVSQLPGATLTYNSTTLTATIDLTGLSQSSLPTDQYALVVTSGVRDTVGNALNGQFNGVFPSGVTNGNGTLFIQRLGPLALAAPRVSSLTLAPATDSGIQGDNNTLFNAPSFIGQVSASFPGAVGGLLVLAQFNGIDHRGVPRGGLNLATGSSGRGFVGTFDVQTITDANGRFVINYPPGVARLPEGQNRIRVVVVGQADQPPFPGLSSSQDTAFRVDNTQPFVGTTNGTPATSIPFGANINSLTSLSVNIVDPVNPMILGDPFAVDPKLGVPALDPGKASNTQNYRLFRFVNGVASQDLSNFILTATYVSTSARTVSSDPFTGRIDLTFAAGLPTGTYRFMLLAAVPFRSPIGLTDAAGNSFAGYSRQSSLGQPVDYWLDFNLQPTPTFITSYGAYTPNTSAPGTFTQTDVRATYEIPIPGVPPRAPAPPTDFVISFSNSLREGVDYSNAVQLLRSANGPGQLPDGDFGDLGITNTSGFTRVNGVIVFVDSSVPGALPGQFGYRNLLVFRLPAGSSLPADYYRVYMPNTGPNAIVNVFGNQLDGEFKGYKDATGKYVNLLPNGQVRGSLSSDFPDLTGDGTPGGAFMSGFVVVPNGNVLYARADALYNPQIPSLNPTGSIDRPFPVLAAEAVFTNANGGNLNSVVNSGANFNPVFDRSGDGQFEPSAFFAAQQLVQANGGPVVIIAQASILSRDPITGNMVQKAFVLQAPAGSDPLVNDGSAAIPALTTLSFQQGSILKMQNASLLVQNQGSALQILGGPNPSQGVTITSYKDSTVGGVSNGDPSTVGAPGDYGGILFRNFSQAALPGGTARTSLFPGQLPITPNSSVNRRLKGQFTNPNDPASQLDAVSGADDVMSFVNFLSQRFAGGVVPQTAGFRYDGITLKNSRPTIVNSGISDTNGADGTAQAGISADVDSLRADDTAQGPLIRNDVFLRNGLNGIYIRPEISGIAEPTNAVAYPTNPATAGGSRNYILDDPYPYLLTSRLVVGQSLVQETGGTQANTLDRFYINPGMILKFSRGSALQVVTVGASLNIGDQTYIRQFDANRNIGPIQPDLLPNGQPNPLAGQPVAGFTPNSAGLAQAILTSINDDLATTFFFDPVSQVRTTIVQPLPAVPGGSGVLQPRPGNVPDAARWGGVSVVSGGIAVINSANLRFGGGTVNAGTGTNTQHVLEIDGGTFGGSLNGAHISITNNVFNDNLDVPINLAENALLAGDLQRPLLSGAPFIHGNVFTSNGLNGVGVEATRFINASNLDVNSVWTGSDFTYILRSTVVLGPDAAVPRDLPAPSTTALQPIPTPLLTLTLQSTLSGTVLADGTTVASPGVPLLIKLQNPDGAFAPLTPDVNPAAALGNAYLGGAGFLVGVDDGVDPTSPFQAPLDPGAFSQIRIVGIGANQTTGQTRVPVIITSLFDNTVGTTVNNVAMFQAVPGSTRAPAAGDGGVIYFGGNSLTDYDLQDPRNGSLIDNADIRFITRIEQQGGGINYLFDINGDNSFTPTGATNDNPYAQKLGYNLGGPFAFGAQYNQAKQLTISNSNLSTFSDYAFVAHPGYALIQFPQNYVSTAIRAGFLGEATHSYLVNNTISNMVRGIEIISEVADNTQIPSPAMAVLLNNTFYNIGTGANTSTASPSAAIRTFAPQPTPTNPLSHVAMLAMDNIFSTIQGDAVIAVGQAYGSNLQYNMFEQVTGNKATPIIIQGDNLPFNNQEVAGAARFRAPTLGNFFLLPTSDAIDRARSELGPSIFGDMIYPASTYVAPGTNAPGNPRDLPIRSAFSGTGGPPTGSVNIQGGFLGGFIPFAVNLVTLPGLPVDQRGFPDQWVPVLQSGGSKSFGTGTNPATFLYVPLPGERDQAGNLRVKDPNSPNVGFGSRPFFDLGAFEFIIQNPPVVTAVQALALGIATNLYVAGGIAGTNRTPSAIQVRFNERIDTNTINGSSVVLQASGGDGIFGNGNSPADRTINLSGQLSFDSNTNILTINTSGVLSNQATLNDQYRLILKGTGSSVLRDLDGLALDGFTANQTLPLPSGTDNFPGSDFLVNFTISTSSPTVNTGTFRLSPNSDTSGGLNITRLNRPTFVGTITDKFPPINPLLGQSVHIDISSKGDGVFDLIDAGLGTTLADGSFSVTLTTPIPDTPNSIGSNGLKGGPNATFAIARVRVINQAGNPSNLPTDPLSTYITANAATFFQVDTQLPVITGFSPLANTVATVNASGGVNVSVTFNESIRPSSLNPASIQVFRTGGTGSFTGTLIPVPIDTSSFGAIVSLDGTFTVNFAIAGPLPNDAYEIILKGTGTNPITDYAGNPISGAFSGTFPTGGSSNQGSDFVNVPFTIFGPTQSNLIYVQAGAASATPSGSRNSPFPTIAAAMATAVIGDNVLVLPGTYRENVVVKAGVRLLSADVSSTDSNYLPGIANQTLLYGVPTATNGFNFINTVFVNGGLVGVPTEVSGFSIISPLLGDPTLGSINQTNVAIFALNSNAVIDRNIIVNGGVGVLLSNSGTNRLASQVFSNVIAGNMVGIAISGSGGNSLTAPYLITNNTIADNTIGLDNLSNSPGVLQAFVVNNIFFTNHDLTTQRNGFAIQSNSINTLGVGTNLFFNNGPSNSSPADDALGSFGAFNPAALSSVPDALGNFAGDPAFVSARDPRPDGDSPPVFFLDANYDLTGRSVAINAANNAVAPATDFLYRSPVRIAGKGFANTGPASIGAYYFRGTGGPTVGGGSGSGSGGKPIVIGGPGSGPGGGNGGIGGGGGVVPRPPVNVIGRASASAANATVTSSIGGGLPIGTRRFNVVDTSLSDQGTGSASDTLGVVASKAAPSYIDINFSNYIDASTLTPSDLVLSGSGLDPMNPAKAIGLAWIDDHAVRFLLSGGFKNDGTVVVSIPPGAVASENGTLMDGYADLFKVASGGTSSAATPVALPFQPIAVAGPVAVAKPGGKKAKNQAAKAAKAAQAAHAAKVAKAAKAAKQEANRKAAAKAARQAAAAKHAKIVKVAHQAKADAKKSM